MAVTFGEGVNVSAAGTKSRVSAGESVGSPVGGEAVSANVYGVIALLLIVAVLFFVWASYTGGGQLKTPRYQQTPENAGIVTAGLNALVNVPGDLGDMSTGHEWKQPDWETRKNVVSRHRYPMHTGGNVSALAHKGWDPMMRPSEKDADWMEIPPTEVTIGGYDPCVNSAE
jgi:hypothetical protein